LEYYDQEKIRGYGIPIKFIEKAEKLSERLSCWDKNAKVLVISHRDGDGISAASVIYQCLKALKFTDFSIEILLSPDLEKLKSLIDEYKPTYIITADIGTDFGNILQKNVVDYLITDHHPNKNDHYGQKQLNPIEFGLNDEDDASGSTTIFLVFYPLFNRDFWGTEIGRVILCYSISGAISDFQLKPNKDPKSVNRFILDMAVDNEAIDRKKDIAPFGRSIYPVYIAFSYANIPGFEDREISNIIINSEIEGKIDGDIWKRIVDLDDTEKEKLMEIIVKRLIDINVESPSIIISDEIIGWVYDLIGLEGYDCTILDDGRRTLDAREILHRVNYCCRMGFSDLALELLNNKYVDPDVLEYVEFYHKEGDKEVAQALELYNNDELPIWNWNNRIFMIDFSGHIYYDEVGVIAGVIMKSNKEIQIILSTCDKEDGYMKMSVRAREEVWNSIDNSNELSDGKKIFNFIKNNYPDEIDRYGGHRWAFSSSIKRKAMEKLFNKIKDYFAELKDKDSGEYLINN
jgi:hypothetical protein